MGVITKKDLYIFRGTYNECMAQKTEDMKIYLAWDSQEIFVGNASGIKVPYGVPKALYRRIDERIEEIKKEALEDTKKLTAELVKSIIDGKINEYFKDLESHIDFKIEEGTEKFKELIPKKISSFENDRGYLTTHQSLDDYAKKQDVINIESKLSNYYTKSAIDQKIDEKISSGDVKLENYYTKAETITQINNADDRLRNELNTKIDSIKPAADLSNYYTKAEVNSKFESFTPDLTEYVKKETLDNYVKKSDIEKPDNDQFLYLTGTEMQTRKDIKMFQMVICTENTATGTTPIYKANQLYSYNGERFKLLSSSGSIDKETISALIKLFATNWPTSGEISNEQITVSNIYSDITKRSAIETYDAYFNGAITKSVKNENNQDDTARVSIDNIVIDKSIAKTYSLEIRATAKVETEDYKYIINNQSSKICSFYQPWLFGELNNFVHYKPNTATMETNISTSNTTVYLYTTTKLLKNPSSGGFEVPFELSADMVSLTVNGVENVKYYEYKLINVNDSKLTINL